MTPPLRFGVATSLDIWNRPVAERRGVLEAIQAGGIDHVFFADHVSFGDGRGHDAMVQAAALANLHPTLGVYVGVYLLALRHPLPVARQLCDLAQMAPGRVTFGIGVGGEDRHEIEVCGVDPSTRGRRTDESLEILERLLGGETVNFDGEFFSLEAAQIKPIPVQSIPITVGGRSDAAVRRAGRFASGWLASWCSPRRFVEAASLFDETAARHERSIEADHGLQVWFGVDDDRKAARHHVATAMEAFYQVPFAAFEKYTPYGTPDQISEWLAPYVETGCRHFNLAPCAGSDEDGIAAAAAVSHRIRQLVGG